MAGSNISEHVMSPLELFIRTGRRQSPRPEGMTEVKFNPWHDPANGRFTFAQGNGTATNKRPDGSWGGGGFTGGGGGSFGGGGATSYEIWPLPSSNKPTKRLTAKPPTKPTVPTPTIPQIRPDGWQAVTKNGYTFRLDASGRTREVTGSITPAKVAEARSRAMQAAAGGKDRLRTDDGGHYIAPRFNGPREAFNHFAQDSHVNRGKYRAMEGDWAKAIKAGGTVKVDIMPVYTAASRRPDDIRITVIMNGKTEIQLLPNRRHHSRRK